MMARVTGMGSSPARCARLPAIADDPFDAAVAALHLMSGAGDPPPRPARAASAPLSGRAPRGSPETLRLYAIFGPQDLAECWTAGL